MRRFCLLLVLTLCGASAAWAQAPEGGAITRANASDGTYVMSIPTGSEVQPRDIYQVYHKGVLMGECMVISVKTSGAVLVPKASYRGAPHVGDRTAFARHADSPVEKGPKWYEFTAPDGSFQVSMPAAPDGPERKLDNSQSIPMTVLTWALTDRANGQIYVVVEAEETQTRLHLADDDAQANYEVKSLGKSGFQVYWVQPLKIQGFVAREVDFTREKLAGRARIVIVNDHRYYLIVMSPKRVGVSSDSYRFLNSLKLKAAANP